MISRRQRGQALIEMAVVVTLLFFLVMGIIEFGRAFMITNMITHGARDGARFGATLEPSLRDNIGCFTADGTDAIVDHVNEQLDNVGVTTADVDVNQCCDDNDIATVTVAITGTIDYVFNLVGSSFNVNRTVTFADENHKCSAGDCGDVCP
jgi:Flp pilus assembly protein TadG